MNLLQRLGIITSIGVGLAFTPTNASPTDTKRIDPYQHTTHSLSYHHDQLTIDGETYVRKNLPKGKTAKVGDTIINSNVILGGYFINYKDIVETEIDREVRTRSDSETIYVLVNLKNENSTFTINNGTTLEPAKIRIKTEKLTNRKTRQRSSLVQKLSQEGKKTNEDGIRVEGKRLLTHSMTNDFFSNYLTQELKDLLSSGGAFEGSVYSHVNSKPELQIIVENRPGENKRTTSLQGYHFTLLPAELVDIPMPQPAQPTQTEEKKPAVEELEETIEPTSEEEKPKESILKKVLGPFKNKTKK